MNVMCGVCGQGNEAGRKFCGECGSPLAVACPSCGSPNPPGTKFCGECGGALTADPSLAAPTAPPQAERRLVSVLFADLVGFTAASEGRDFGELSAPFPLAVVQTEHAETLLAGGRDVDELVAEAGPVFERLAAQPWLERLARLRTGVTA